MDDQKTEVYEQMDLGDPVDTIHDLPNPGKEGQSRYVRDENAVFAYRNGAWVKEIYKKG